jgi:hypothetical protein
MISAYGSSSPPQLHGRRLHNATIFLKPKKRTAECLQQKVWEGAHVPEVNKLLDWPTRIVRGATTETSSKRMTDARYPPFDLALFLDVERGPWDPLLNAMVRSYDQRSTSFTKTFDTPVPRVLCLRCRKYWSQKLLMIETVENHSGGDGGALESCKPCCCLSACTTERRGWRSSWTAVRLREFYLADHY